MKTEEVTMVRVYCTESEHKLDAILNLLHDKEKVAGVTAFRGIAGFGRSGKLHTASLLDLSLDMPVIVEFYDRPEKVGEVLSQLENMVPAGHLVSWQAQVNLGK